jgi:hypothetical protein
MVQSSVTTDAVISLNNKRIKAAAEPVPLSSIHSMSVDAKLDYSVKKTSPTPEECYLVVHELGKLHPDVISANNEHRRTFALHKQLKNEISLSPLLQSNNNDFTSLSSISNNTSTPITDAIISTMLSQNTTVPIRIEHLQH